MQSLSDIFSHRLGSIQIADLVRLHQVRKIWPHLVGKVLAEQTFVQEIKKDQLWVRAESSVWLSELQFRQLEIQQGLWQQAKVKIVTIHGVMATLPQARQTE